jgi:hypothetical protein
VLFVTATVPVVGGGVGQSTENGAVVVPPAGTVAVCDIPPLTVQLPATPESATVWLPDASVEKVTLPVAGMA